MSVGAIGQNWIVAGGGSLSKQERDTSGVDAFMAYMNKSQAERMEDAWLKKNNMTREQFEALPPEEKQKLLAKMRAEIELQLKETMRSKLDKGAQFLI